MSTLKIPIGATVVRGPDWKWGDQDGGPGNKGTVQRHRAADIQLPYVVRWSNGSSNSYNERHLTVIGLPGEPLMLGDTVNTESYGNRPAVILGLASGLVRYGWPADIIGASADFRNGEDLIGNPLPQWWLDKYQTYFFLMSAKSTIVHLNQRLSQTPAEPSKGTLTLDDLDGRLVWRQYAPELLSLGKVRLLRKVEGRWRALYPSDAPDAELLIPKGMSSTLIVGGTVLNMKHFYYQNPTITQEHLDRGDIRFATEEEQRTFLSVYASVSRESVKERFNGKVVIIKQTEICRGIRIVHYTGEEQWVTLKPYEFKDGAIIHSIPDEYQVAGRTVFKDRLNYSHVSPGDIERLASPEEEEYFYNEYLRFNPDLVPEPSLSEPVNASESPEPRPEPNADPYEQFNGRLVFRQSANDTELRGLRICCKADGTWYSLKPYKHPDAGLKKSLPPFFDIQGKRLLREKLFYISGVHMDDVRLATPEEERFFVQKYLELNPEPAVSVSSISESFVPDPSSPAAPTMTQQQKIDRYHMKLVRTNSWDDTCDHVRLAVWIGDRFVVARPDKNPDATRYYPHEFLSKTVTINGVTIRLDRMWCFTSSLVQCDLELATSEQSNSFVTEYLRCNPDSVRLNAESAGISSPSSSSSILNRHSVIVPSPTIPSSSDRFLRTA